MNTSTSTKLVTFITYYNIKTHLFKTVGFIFRNTGIFKYVMSLLYFVIKSPREYCRIVWDSIHKNPINLIHRIQRKCIASLNYKRYNDEIIYI